MIARLLAALGLAAFAPALWADALTGDVQRQPLNVSAIVMFVAFVGATLCITYWASKRNRSAADYYAAGGRITGFQNGLAIAGDYMSAASFLGISALVFTSGYDGLIYSIGFLVGWPIILFLIAERLRNLGKYTFADVASYRLKQKQIRTLSACGSLVVVAFYLIAQMVGAGKLIELLFGLNYHVAVVLVGILMVLYVLFGGMLATTWVQIIKAVLLLSGASFMAIMVLKHVNFDVSTLFSEAIKVHPKGEAIMSPGGLVKDPISAFSLGFALMFGTAGLPHILMRFFTVSDAKEARKSVFYATGFIGYFYILTFIIGFGAILLVSTNPDFKDATGALIGGNNMAAVHLADAVGGSLFLGFISAVAFATILAVVAGLTLAGASAVSHDLYASVFKGGKANEKDEPAGLEDDHRGPGRGRHRARHPLREAEHRLHGRPGLLHRRQLQLPGAAALHVLEEADHPRRHDRRLDGPDHRGGPDGPRPDHLGADPRPRESHLPVRVPGAVLDDRRLRRYLVLLHHRQVGGGRRGAGALLPAVHPFPDRPGRLWRGGPLSAT